jgi:hypothetical protein
MKKQGKTCHGHNLGVGKKATSYLLRILDLGKLRISMMILGMGSEIPTADLLCFIKKSFNSFYHVGNVGIGEMEFFILTTTHVWQHVASLGI